MPIEIVPTLDQDWEEPVKPTKREMEIANSLKLDIENMEKCGVDGVLELIGAFLADYKMELVEVAKNTNLYDVEVVIEALENYGVGG